MRKPVPPLFKRFSRISSCCGVLLCTCVWTPSISWVASEASDSEKDTFARHHSACRLPQMQLAVYA